MNVDTIIPSFWVSISRSYNMVNRVAFDVDRKFHLDYTVRKLSSKTDSAVIIVMVMKRVSFCNIHSYVHLIVVNMYNSSPYLSYDLDKCAQKIEMYYKGLGHIF